MEINAAVFRKVHEKLTIEAVDIDKPWGREVLVRTAATGVCHSDLHVVDGQGRFPLDRPIVLGHEGAGVVEAVGAEVTAAGPRSHRRCLRGSAATPAMPPAIRICAPAARHRLRLQTRSRKWPAAKFIGIELC
jgi:D-arabinose 1-dehydrogenase-like Zn-dependent alcohol dehydrogenase